MGKITVGEKDGNVRCSLSFGSTASVSQALSIMLDLNNWSEYFPGLIGNARILNDKVDPMSTEVEIKVPLLPEKCWTIVSESKLTIEDDKVLVSGRNISTGDWAETEFQLNLLPPVKKHHGCRIEVSTSTPQSDLLVPKPILIALMRFAKPVLKKTLNRLAMLNATSQGETPVDLLRVC